MVPYVVLLMLSTVEDHAYQIFEFMLHLVRSSQFYRFFTVFLLLQ